MSEVGLQNSKVKINKMKLFELRWDRLKRMLGKLITDVKEPSRGENQKLQVAILSKI